VPITNVSIQISKGIEAPQRHRDVKLGPQSETVACHFLKPLLRVIVVLASSYSFEPVCCLHLRRFSVFNTLCRFPLSCILGAAVRDCSRSLSATFNR